MGPHEYYDNWHGYDHHDHMPHLHNRGAAHTYLEPDWFANHLDAQLPAISTIGRGPQGESVTAEPVYDSYNNDGAPAEGAGIIGFKILDDDGNVLFDSGTSLLPPTIELTYPDLDGIDPGQPLPVTVTVTNQGKPKSYTFYVPPGVRGSLIFLLEDTLDPREDDTYTTTVGALTVYGKKEYRNKPAPRPDDTIIFTTWNKDGTERLLCLGTVESVGKFKRTDVGGVVLPYRDPEDGSEIHMVAYNDNEVEPTDRVVFTSRVTLDNLRGPAGPAGPEGPEGPEGPQGPEGPEGPEGPAMQFSDLTEAQILELKTDVQTVFMQKKETVVESDGSSAYVVIPPSLGYKSTSMLFVDINGLSVSSPTHYKVLTIQGNTRALFFYDDGGSLINVPEGEIHITCLNSVAVEPGDLEEVFEISAAHLWGEADISVDSPALWEGYKNIVIDLVDETEGYAPAMDEIVSVRGVDLLLDEPCALGGWHLEQPSNADTQIWVKVVPISGQPGAQGSILCLFTYRNLGHGRHIE